MINNKLTLSCVSDGNLLIELSEPARFSLINWLGNVKSWIELILVDLTIPNVSFFIILLLLLFVLLIAKLPVDDLVEQELPIPELLILDLWSSQDEKSSFKIDDDDDFVLLSLFNSVSISLVFI